jgi:hypothetical protein|tara:strand:- start:135 stop:386 length:252 start_codon:yes stop_codon:yes gene_type:complete
MKKLPDWFEGEIYEIGDEVRNPFSGETCVLNANELSMYDLIKGAEMAMTMGVVLDTDECIKILNEGAEWIKKNNPKAYKILLD